MPSVRMRPRAHLGLPLLLLLAATFTAGKGLKKEPLGAGDYGLFFHFSFSGESIARGVYTSAESALWLTAEVAPTHERTTVEDTTLLERKLCLRSKPKEVGKCSNTDRSGIRS
ncbi:hypothetical protein NDU88_013236 [Pleurodeles waltl]|uniref:Uncharacterized protein n=1 Tax=Pleurodeles waltl TaxID=8319 RepID=A0AAV7R429_PLEWA|nr:hypothetical protein NDU88_013236 [Pleurodeles waltl]